jgi:hypothetical protein
MRSFAPGDFQSKVKAKTTCPKCGKSFLPWREKKFCSERCRKQAQNRRLGYVRRDGATPIADCQKSQNLDVQNQGVAKAFRRDEPLPRDLDWVACNEVTHKHAKPGGDAVGWAMLVEGRGWFGRVRDERGDWSFGPSILSRCQRAVEAWLRHEPFDKVGDEKTWRGDCWRLLSGLAAIHEET